MLFNPNGDAVQSPGTFIGLCDVASLHSHTPPALCSLVMAQLLHLQETHRAALPPPQNRPNLPQEEGDETG